MRGEELLVLVDVLDDTLNMARGALFLICLSIHLKSEIPYNLRLHVNILLEYLPKIICHIFLIWTKRFDAKCYSGHGQEII